MQGDIHDLPAAQLGLQLSDADLLGAKLLLQLLVLVAQLMVGLAKLQVTQYQGCGLVRHRPCQIRHK